MILPDINLLVFAYSAGALQHRRAKSWWEDLLTRGEPIGIPWAVTLGYIRIMTHPTVLERPLRPADALSDVRSWFAIPHVEVLHPGPRHLDILEGLLRGLDVAGNLLTDAHLAALAIEYQCELHSNDKDFSRFSGLRWRDPVS